MKRWAIIVALALVLSLLLLALFPKSSVSEDTSSARNSDITIEYSSSPPDERPEKIRSYFNLFGTTLPAADYAEEFVSTADKYDLPYTLLPAIAMQESSGFKVMVGNNGFGFGCTYPPTTRGCIPFASISAAIEGVGKELSQGDLYASKSARLKLETYNGSDYADTIEWIMEEIDN